MEKPQVHARRYSNPQSSASKSDALSIAPGVLYLASMWRCRTKRRAVIVQGQTVFQKKEVNRTKSARSTNPEPPVSKSDALSIAPRALHIVLRRGERPCAGPPVWPKKKSIAPTRDRTDDLAVNSRSLYQRSSVGKVSCGKLQEDANA